MRGLIGVTRIYLKHVAILLAVGSVLEFAWAGTPGQAGAQHAAPLLGAQEALKRPRITGIDHVGLYVSDLGKANEFYAQQLGLSTNASGGCQGAPHRCFQVNGQQQIELQRVPSPAPKNWLFEIAYATDDVEQMRRYLVAHKIEVTPITKDPNGARHFEVQDPEGNTLAFIQRAVSPKDWAISSNQVGAKLFHAGFVVKDMAAENRFYVDLLGFKLYWYGGFKDDGVDWYEIQVPDGDNWIEYMLNIPANADKKELGVQNHFSLGTRDAKDAAAQLRKNGVQKIDGPEIGRDGKNALDVYDPDGTRVEVMEFTPTQKPCCHPYSAPHPQP
jgi:catechol 2,3-dioxygenase-like lactoylglutathione lyase family enzyme